MGPAGSEVVVSRRTRPAVRLDSTTEARRTHAFVPLWQVTGNQVRDAGYAHAVPG
jgi:hypothetical protein